MNEQYGQFTHAYQSSRKHVYNQVGTALARATAPHLTRRSSWKDHHACLEATAIMVLSSHSLVHEHLVLPQLMYAEVSRCCSTVKSGFLCPTYTTT